MPTNEMEQKLRDVIEAAIGLSGSSGIGLAIKVLTSFLPKLNSLIGEFDGPREVWLAELTEAIDGLVGTEPDAMIGPNGSLIAFDIPVVDDEKVYDLLLQAISTLAVEAKKELPS